MAGQFAAVEPAMTGRENLELTARLFGHRVRAARRAAAAVIDQLSLGPVADRRTSTYSGGQRRRLDMGASLVGALRLLLLDEPTTGLDPVSRREVWDAVRGLAAAGTDVLLTTYYLDEADELADHVVVIGPATRGVHADRGAALPPGLSDQVTGTASGTASGMAKSTSGTLRLVTGGTASIVTRGPRSLGWRSCRATQLRSTSSRSCQRGGLATVSPRCTNASSWAASVRRVSSGRRTETASAWSAGTGRHHSTGPSLSSLTSPQ